MDSTKSADTPRRKKFNFLIETIFSKLLSNNNGVYARFCGAGKGAVVKRFGDFP